MTILRSKPQPFIPSLSSLTGVPVGPTTRLHVRRHGALLRTSLFASLSLSLSARAGAAGGLTPPCHTIRSPRHGCATPSLDSQHLSFLLSFCLPPRSFAGCPHGGLVGTEVSFFGCDRNPFFLSSSFLPLNRTTSLNQLTDINLGRVGEIHNGGEIPC